MKKYFFMLNNAAQINQFFDVWFSQCIFEDEKTPTRKVCSFLRRVIISELVVVLQFTFL